MKKILYFILFIFPIWLNAETFEKIRVASLSTILTEVAQQVGGDRVIVTGIIKPGIDPHEFEPKPADIAIITEAQLILASGKHLESYLTKIHQNSNTRGVLVEVGDRFPSLKSKHEAETDHKAHSHSEDPHWWHSIANVKLAAAVVRDELIKIDPSGSADYRKNATAYTNKLDELEKWAKLKISELPRDQRKLVTSHDAFQYFAREFGFTIYAIEGISKEDEASNRKVTNIIDSIKKQHVKAIFGEFGTNPKVLQTITRDTGAKIGGELFADGLGLDDASTYEGMIKHNITTIVNGLK